jgi:hypothetical protein
MCLPSSEVPAPPIAYSGRPQKDSRSTQKPLSQLGGNHLAHNRSIKHCDGSSELTPSLFDVVPAHRAPVGMLVPSLNRAT